MTIPGTLLDTTIAVLGASGPLGRGLTLRFATAGLRVVVGSRDADRAKTESQRLAEMSGGDVRGLINTEAAVEGDIVVVAVPWHGHAELLSALRTELSGKIVVDCVNPLGFDKRGAHALSVPEGSAAEQAAELLTDSTVIGAFHNVSAVLLEDLIGNPRIETDVLVLGEERGAADRIQDLVSVIPGMRGIYGGRLRNSHQVESLTANLISINRRHKTHAGLRITGL